MVEIERHRTAIGRGGDLSRPVRLGVEAGLLGASTSFFDFGCGRGEDVAILRTQGLSACGWDPAHNPLSTKEPAHVVNLGYVVNVIENAQERIDALREAWELTQSILIVAARLTFDSRLTREEPFADGCLTATDTFQKFFTQTELRTWIQESIGVEPVAAAPGVFFVFREEELKHDYLSRRYRRRRAAPRVTKSERRFEEHRELLESLIEFVTDRARIPQEGELDSAEAICEIFGSLKRAFSLVRRVTGSEKWEDIRHERVEELLLQLALDRFGGRPRFSELPIGLQRDVREFFSSYKAACEQADELLFSVGDVERVDAAIAESPIGKRTGNGLYVHVDWIHRLSPLLRLYEGCARIYLGSTEDANVVKLHRGTPRISYLSYPGFDKEAHPALEDSFLVKLGALEVSYRNYTGYKNPPILHRLEELLCDQDERYERLANLTRQEERWGLYESPDQIGTRNGWEAILTDKGAEYRGRRLIRRRLSTLGADG